MKKNFISIFSVLMMMGFVLAPAGNLFSFSVVAEPTHRKIVIFKSGALNEEDRGALIVKFGGIKIKDLNLINGASVYLSPKADAILKKQSSVLRIEDDIQVTTLAKVASYQPAEIMPWGIKKINADSAWTITTGEAVKIGIIDTGIDASHLDLINNLKGGVSTVSYTASYNDDNGHGTHVAGTIAAVDNEIGVIGVGPNIQLYAIKVLDRRGSGYLSDVIEGLDWARQNGMQVVNMSLGTNVYSQAFEDAVKRVNVAGIVQVAAAGNNYGGTVTYPAKFAEVIAVSAIDINNQIAYFSSVGSEVDLAAPGVNIYSTYKKGAYNTLSGTSMASPHVAGVAALILNTPIGLYDANLNGRWEPSEVQKKMQDTATDLGVVGFDNLFGWGLVNAALGVR